MKKIILILLLAVSFTCCFDDDYTGCPDYMTLSFYLDDDHVPGTYDTRIGNGVRLHFFKDERLVSSLEIPYAEIQAGKEYTIRKTEDMSGDLDLVAWAVPVGKPLQYIPSAALGDRMEDHCLSMEPFARAAEYHNPKLCDIYLGRVSTGEAVDEPTSHRVAMIYAGCRITVNVTDEREVLDDNSEICVNGTMSRMNMWKEGVGEEALVYVDLECSSAGSQDYSTEQFCVLPSPAGEELSVSIYNSNSKLVTLTVPRDNFPRGAQAGDLIIFDHTLGTNEFTLIVNGFRQIFYSVTT